MLLKNVHSVHVKLVCDVLDTRRITIEIKPGGNSRIKIEKYIVYFKRYLIQIPFSRLIFLIQNYAE